jgi:hypothetical protein
MDPVLNDGTVKIWGGISDISEISRHLQDEVTAPWFLLLCIISVD